MTDTARHPATWYPARWTAAVRERESAREDRLFDDPWAGLLAGDVGRAAMAASERASGARNEFIPIRARWFEDLIVEAASVRDPEFERGGIGPATQAVILGSGFDTRAFRLPVRPDLAWFEVDDGALLADKVATLARAGANARCRRHLVDADLRGDWPRALEAAGFAPDAATLWVAEGLLFYLAPDVVASLLAGARRLSGPGSAFAADASGTGLLRAPGMARYLESLAARGAPMPFASDDPASLLHAGGWSDVTIAEPGLLARRYGRPLSKSVGAGDGPGGEPAAPDPTMRSYFFVGRVGEDVPDGAPASR